jgi:hypothetical protein
MDLKVVIGENVTRLSNLEGVTLDNYKTKVLPKLLELVIINIILNSIKGYLIKGCYLSRVPCRLYYLSIPG